MRYHLHLQELPTPQDGDMRHVRAKITSEDLNDDDDNSSSTVSSSPFAVPGTLLDPQSEEERALLMGFVFQHALRPAPDQLSSGLDMTMREWCVWISSDAEREICVTLSRHDETHVAFDWTSEEDVESWADVARSWQAREKLMGQAEVQRSTARGGKFKL